MFQSFRLLVRCASARANPRTNFSETRATLANTQDACFHRGMSLQKIFVTAACLVAADAAAAPRKVLTAFYPVSFREVGKTPNLALGASLIEIDRSKSDLELIVWKVDKTHALEVNIDVRNVNQSVLETDANGKLLAKITEMSAVPWIKVYWPGQAPQTLDVKCVSQLNVCQGVWKNFPYDASGERAVKIEANLRGLEGKIWSPVLNSHRLLGSETAELNLRDTTLKAPYRVQAKAEAAEVRISALYDLLKMPAAFSQMKLLSIYNWSFRNDAKLRETGFFRTLHKTLFKPDNGQFLLDTLAQSTLQSQDLAAGQAFFAESGVVLSLASRKTGGTPESALRALEFE